MQLDSYEKASLDILRHLQADPIVFIINSIQFRVVISLAASNRLGLCTFSSYEHISILDAVPDIYNEIQMALPYPPNDRLKTNNHFVTELVGQYNESWIPISSPDYSSTLITNFHHDLNMIEWQRYLRSTLSQDRIELTILSIDPSQKVRDTAIQRLKTLN